MANDLTGQNIKDTYKRVLTVGDNGLMYDGTGSLYTPLSASHEITTELSSSHAVNADTASFATNFTASGNISSSGTITGYDINASRDITIGRNIGVTGDYTSNGTTRLGNSIDDHTTILGNVTASGAISSSGEVIAISGSFEVIHGGTF